MFLKYNKWALLWALLIFILCAIPGKDIPSVSWLDIVGIDKLIHAILFFVQAILLINGFKNQTKFEIFKRAGYTLSVVLCIIYGGLLEMMQGTFYTDRTADLYDFIANSFGAMAGAVFFRSKL